MPTPNPVPGSLLAPMTFPGPGGGTLDVGAPRDTWTLLVVYRGRHCGRCKTYLAKLDGMLKDWTGRDSTSRSCRRTRSTRPGRMWKNSDGASISATT